MVILLLLSLPALAVAAGAGHHSVLHAPGSDRWYIVYHRRPAGGDGPQPPRGCIDELRFRADGSIEPVTITNEGVARDPLAQSALAAYRFEMVPRRGSPPPRPP